MICSVPAAGISLLMGLGVITAIELSVGKSLACWVRDECPVESSSTNDGEETQTHNCPSSVAPVRATRLRRVSILIPSHSQLFLLVQEFQVQEYSVLTPSKS